MLDENVSVLTTSPFEPPYSITCGYCSPRGQRSEEETNYRDTGCYSLQMSCKDYQTMMDRGWIRCGMYFYKPDLKRSCCPQYVIRLDTLQFKPTRSQRKLINRFNRWVIYGGDHHSDEHQRKGKNHVPFSFDEAIHAAEYGYHTNNGASEPAHRFEVTLEPLSYSHEKSALASAYQREIHKLPFGTLDVEDPLIREVIPYSSTPPNHLPRHYGAYHQLYRLDGELVALGTIDILPNCISSDYFMYDNKLERFSLGKLSILHELTLVREMHAAGAPGMQYLYLGYYVHSCSKMQYKGEFAPSYLADPEEYTWHPLEECLPLLDRYRYACFACPDHSIEGEYVEPEVERKMYDVLEYSETVLVQGSEDVYPESAE